MKAFDHFINKFERTFFLYHITIFVILGFILYFKALTNNFVWDDEDQIPNNPLLQHIENLPYLLTHSGFYMGGSQPGMLALYFRPMLSLSFFMTNAVWGLNPFGFHIANVALHIINTMLVFSLLKRLLDRNKFDFAKTAAFVGSTLFLVHPVNVESVAYISAAPELLYTCFLLIALHLAISIGFGEKISVWKLAILSLIVLLSLLSKESGIMAIPFIIFLSYLFFRKKLLSFCIALAVPLGIYGILRLKFAELSTISESSIIPIAKASVFERVLTVPYEIFSYIRLFFFPKDLYIAQADVVKSTDDPRFFLSLIIVALVFIAAGTLLIKYKSKLLIFFSFWFVISLGLLVHIIPLDYTIAERWMYVPFIGLYGIVSIITSQILSHKNFTKKIVFSVIISIAVIFLSLRTVIRTFDWESPLTLFGHDVQFSKSAELHTNYGTALYKNGLKEESKKEYLKGIALAPNNMWALNNLGSIYATDGDYAKAKELYQQSIKVTPNDTAYENLAQIYYLTENPPQVLEYLKQVLPLLPNSAKLNHIAALSFNAIGATDSAKLHAQKSAQLDQSPENLTPLLPLLR